MTSSTSNIRVAALYRFAPVADPTAMRSALLDICRRHDVRGTLIVAGEGVNGTLAGPPDGVDAVVAALKGFDGFADLAPKFSSASAMPFHRLKVRLKGEIVTMGRPDVDPARAAGTYVHPRDWNDLIADPGTVVIDTRNGYETALGSFAGALDPATVSFRDFPAWLDARAEELRGKRVAMFCTGGIRCEKATAYARSIGIDDVHHLEGGILAYLEQTPEADSLWRGECFVFDERVAVTAGLEEGEAELCRACRHPLKPAERASPLYVEGSSCPRCHGSRSEADRARYAERHRQVALAEARGDGPHIGGKPAL